MKIGILGSGTVAQTLAAGLARHGHDVMLGTRDTSKLIEWQSHNHASLLGGVTDAAVFGEVLVLAVKDSRRLRYSAPLAVSISKERL